MLDTLRALVGKPKRRFDLRVDTDPNPPYGVGSVLMEVFEGKKIVEGYSVNLSYELAYELVTNHDFQSVLDIGCGKGEHSKVFKAMGKDVTMLDPYYEVDVKADLLEWETDEQFDVVFCSHVVEHQRNVGEFLDKMIARCKPDGLICISVPPEMIQFFLLCHPNQFNAGMLLYHLILAGVDCREAKILTYGYNVSVIVPNKKHNLPKRAAALELETFPYFPECFTSTDGRQIFGPVRAWNWESRLNLEPHFNSGLPLQEPEQQPEEAA